MRTKLISSVVLAAIALATWRFVSPPTGVPHIEAGSLPLMVNTPG